METVIFRLAVLIDEMDGKVVQPKVLHPNRLRIGSALRYDNFRAGMVITINQTMTLRGDHRRVRLNFSGSNWVRLMNRRRMHAGAIDLLMGPEKYFSGTCQVLFTVET